MLYREIIAVCSQIHTKHINTAVWAERRLFRLLLASCPSVCPHVSTRLLLDGVPGNLILVTFIKSVELQILAALSSQSVPLHGHTHTSVRCTVAGDVKALLYNPQYFTLLVVTCNSPIRVINALLCFHWSNRYTNTPQCDILRTLPISLKLNLGFKGLHYKTVKSKP